LAKRIVACTLRRTKDLRTPPRAGFFTGRGEGAALTAGFGTVLFFDLFVAAVLTDRCKTFFALPGFVARACVLLVVFFFFRGAMWVLCDFSTGGTY
jgi:hypothetical protein